MASFADNLDKNNVDEKVVQVAVKAIQQQNGLPNFAPVQAAIKAIQEHNVLPNIAPVTAAAIKAIQQHTGLSNVEQVVQVAVNAIQQQNGLSNVDPLTAAAIKAIQTQNGLPNVEQVAEQVADNAFPKQIVLSNVDPLTAAAVKAIQQHNVLSTHTTKRDGLSSFKNGISTAVNDAMDKFGRLFGKVSLQSITFPMEGQMRRGPINFAQTVTIANTADPTKNPTEHTIFDTDVITPTYKTSYDFFPDRYDIAFAMGAITDKTPELNALNAGIEAQLKLLSNMIKYVNEETDKLKKYKGSTKHRNEYLA
jgi:peptidoglycan hydrolase-like protein with peptidoglycan-binding domain